MADTNSLYDRCVDRTETLAGNLHVRLMEHAPFFGMATRLLGHLVPDPEIKTIGTDGIRIYYNPYFLGDMDAAEVYYILMHELYHILFYHKIRAAKMKGALSGALWNIACDYVVNYEISIQARFFREVVGIRLSVPEDALLMSGKGGEVQIAGQTAEEVYEQLVSNYKSRQDGGARDGGGRDGGQDGGRQDGGGQDGGGQDSVRQDSVRQDSVGEDGAESDDSPYDYLSGVVVRGRAVQQDSVAVQSGKGRWSGKDSPIIPTGQYGDYDLFNVEPSRAGMNADIVSAIVNSVYRQGRAGGCSLAGHTALLKMSFLATHSPKIRWDKYLRRYLTEKKSYETSYYTPNRKYFPYDLIVPGPGENEDQIDSLFLFVDTSGSMTERELREIMGQVRSIAVDYDCRVSVAFWNTRVWPVYRDIAPEDYDRTEALFKKASGGTLLKCVFDYIEQERLSSAAFLIFTDGRSPIPKVKSRISKRTLLALENTRTYDHRLDKVGRVVSYTGN